MQTAAWKTLFLFKNIRTEKTAPFFQKELFPILFLILFFCPFRICQQCPSHSGQIELMIFHSLNQGSRLAWPAPEPFSKRSVNTVSSPTDPTVIEGFPVSFLAHPARFNDDPSNSGSQ